MKTKLLLFFLLTLSFTASAQSIMTFRQVYDFSVGDKFQFSGTSFPFPSFPNAQRTTIMGKYFSANSDTVFYIEYHDDYVIWSDGDSVHNDFTTFTDTVFYTELDTTTLAAASYILSDPNVHDFDTINLFSVEYCDSLVNGYSYIVGWFEPPSYKVVYGKGLGRVDNYFDDPSEFYGYETKMFYYEKNGVGCGTPDTLTTAVSTKKLADINMYPNPANRYFVVESKGDKILKMSIYNSRGKLMDSQNINKNRMVYQCGSFRSGIYFIRLITREKIVVKKLVVK